MDEKIIKLLYRSFDEHLNPADQKELDNALRLSKELKEEKERILSIRNKIEGCRDQSFKPFFADRIMQRINAISEVDYNEILDESLFKIFRPVMIAAILLILIITSYNVTSSKQFSLEGMLAVPQVTMEQAFDPSLSYNVEE